MFKAYLLVLAIALIPNFSNIVVQPYTGEFQLDADPSDPDFVADGGDLNAPIVYLV